MKNTPEISIIIPTVNAPAELDLALNSLKKNSSLTLEYLIMVDPDQRTQKINPTILKVCQKHQITPHLNSKNLGPYGSWNRGAHLSHGQYLVFATDDQYFAPGWDRSLLAASAPKRLVVGRLVEPGIIPVYKTNIQIDFGVTPAEFREADFLAWCQTQRDRGFVPDGFFIPMLISRRDFSFLGDFPTNGTFGTRSAVSNDYDYIQSALKRGFTFGTADGSLSYHFQGSSWKKKNLHPHITAVVLTKNSAKTLASTLKSLEWVTSILVVDAHSSDDTAKIAKDHGAQLKTHPFVDFASQRNFALKHSASADWVFMLDADEVCEPALAQELRSAALDIYLDGVNVRRKNYIWGQWIEHTDWYPDLRLVFFRPRAVTFVAGVHERATFVKGGGNTIDSTHHILHYNYTTVAEFVQKNLLTYPQAYAHELDRTGVQFDPLAMVTSSLSEFMRRYFLARGYLDGMYGLALSLLMGLQQLLSYLYLWEIQGKSRDFSLLDFRRLLQGLKQKSPELKYWLHTTEIELKRGLPRYFARLKRKTHQLIKGL